MSKRVVYIILIVVVLSAVAALFATLFNKRWWIKRAVDKWNLKREEIDGTVWYSFTTGNLASFSEANLLKQPLRRLREFYDTGDLKAPGGGSTYTEEDAPDE